MWRYRQLSIGWLSVCTKLKIKEFSNIPQTPNQQSMKEFLNDLGVKGDAPGVCWDSLRVMFFCAPHMDTMISYAMSVEEMDIDYRCKYVYPHISIYICIINIVDIVAYSLYISFFWIKIGGLIQCIAQVFDFCWIKELLESAFHATFPTVSRKSHDLTFPLNPGWLIGILISSVVYSNPHITG